MPHKVKVLLMMMALAVVLNLVTGKWISTLITGLLALGVLKGSEGSRVLVMTLAALSLIGSAVVGFFALGLLSPLGLFVAAIGAGQAGFMLWCLSQPDVQDWMYRRSLPESVRDL